MKDKKNQLEILYDPIINICEFKEKKFDKIDDFLRDKKFILGIDRPKMKLYDCEQQAQKNLVDSGQEIPKSQQVNTEDWKF